VPRVPRHALAPTQCATGSRTVPTGATRTNSTARTTTALTPTRYTTVSCAALCYEAKLSYYTVLSYSTRTPAQYYSVQYSALCSLS